MIKPAPAPEYGQPLSEDELTGPTTCTRIWVADVNGVNLGDGLTGRHFSTFVQVTDPVTGVGKDDFYDTDFAGFVDMYT